MFLVPDLVSFRRMLGSSPRGVLSVPRWRGGADVDPPYGRSYAISGRARPVPGGDGGWSRFCFLETFHSLLNSFDVSNPVVAKGVFSFIIAVRRFLEVMYV